jgi:multidrug efflux pump subunit AcrA (membrane-fusion protein)
MTRPPLRTWAIIAAALAVLAGLGWVVATQGPMAPVLVTTARAEQAELAPTVFGIGTVEAHRSHVLGPTAAGRVLRVLVDEGERVAAGQLLAEMDPVDLELRVDAARAAQARALQGMAAAQAQLAEAGSRWRLAAATVSRYEQLHAEQFYSGDAVEAKRHEAQAAAAAEQAAKASLGAAQAEARRTAAELDAVHRQRGQLRLLAPADGVVAARHADPGTTLVAGQPLLSVVDPAGLRLSARIDQARAGGIAVGQPATVVLRSRPGAALAGRVERLGWVGDAVTEERIVEIAFDQMPQGVSLGDLAEVTVQLPRVAALAVPSAGIRRTEGGAAVWRYADGRAKRQAIAVGAADAGGRTQVVSGLAAGDTVIVYSGQPLAEGLRVKVVAALGGGR